MSVKTTLAATYRRVVPEPLRRFVRNRIARNGYSREFFTQLDELQAASYDVMAATLVDRLAPRSVVDVGCGSGALLAALQRRGVPTLLGLESSPEGLALARRRGVDARSCDLGHPFTLNRDFDLAVCLEVAEHLPEPLADAFVASLASGPNHLVFSAATPGQGGENHVNEQPHDYWIAKLAGHGFVVDTEATRDVRAEWSARDVAPWYCSNVIFFERS
jgi:SAM-dependent methyltransferase